ncbi:hypothetical protein F0562_017445 [Nyssa sinensis]|uniref:Uncharacterized protein n=1 Tax=Nyssa sinensis TaxID=561372 RepID=A0A5J4ZI23_9ASTE|nr:hypothetical protein F0562_017445 [Nyssa sinensis]
MMEELCKRTRRSSQHGHSILLSHAMMISSFQMVVATVLAKYDLLNGKPQRFENCGGHGGLLVVANELARI